MFRNIQIFFIISKTYDQQFCLTTKKSLHIIFKTGHVRMRLWLVVPVDKKQRDTFSRRGYATRYTARRKATAETTVMSCYYANFYQW